ncbi:MAG TPA: ATP-grasp domain-containing protein [Planctomycetota bacterium]|nr:ATP-grasp domain-containing protein [Planctomycetota bacterium]
MDRNFVYEARGPGKAVVDQSIQGRDRDRQNPSRQKVTVLISSAGRRVGLMNLFRESGDKLGLDLRVLASDMDPALSSACRVADRSFRMQACNSAGYVDALIELCGQNQVDLVVPTIDPELEILAKAQRDGRFGATRIAVSDPGTIALVRDKLASSVHLTRWGIPVPKTVPAADALASADSWTWPLFAKRISGSRSVGAKVVRDPDSLRVFMAEHPDLIVQEVCIGREYTVNLYIDLQGVLRSIAAHLRIEVRDGEVSKGVTVRDSRLEDLARALVQAIPGLRGPVCFQAFMEDARQRLPRVTDINARFGGGYPLSHAAGAEFTTFLLAEQAGLDWDWGPVAFREGVVMLRYDAAVFVPPEASKAT